MESSEFQEFEEGKNYLLLSSSESNGRECHDHLTQFGISDTNFLVTAYGMEPDSWVDNWRRNNPGRQMPDELCIVSVGEKTRSASATNSNDFVELTPTPVECVSNPEDVSKLGITISKKLEEWTENDNHTVACFDSVTSLLEYVDLRTAFSFLYLTTRRVKHVKGSGHFHLDPDLHDEKTVNTLKVLFDDIVNHSE